MYECSAFMYVCMHTTMCMAPQSRRGDQMPWNRSSRWFETPCVCWASTLALQKVVLTAEPPLQL